MQLLHSYTTEKRLASEQDYKNLLIELELKGTHSSWMGRVRGSDNISGRGQEREGEKLGGTDIELYRQHNTYRSFTLQTHKPMNTATHRVPHISLFFSFLFSTPY